MTFQLHPAVRSPDGNCVEEVGCLWERVTLCAFNQTNTAGKVAFLACMDGRAATKETYTQAALNAAKRCASTATINVDQMTTCYHGKEGDQLLSEAAKVWNKQFPGQTFVPHTFVNSKNIQADYQDLKNAICAEVSSPACKGIKLNYL